MRPLAYSKKIKVINSTLAPLHSMPIKIKKICAKFHYNRTIFRGGPQTLKFLSFFPYNNFG